MRRLDITPPQCGGARAPRAHDKTHNPPAHRTASLARRLAQARPSRTSHPLPPLQHRCQRPNSQLKCRCAALSAELLNAPLHAARLAHMAAWAPQPEGLHTIVQLLTEYRQPGANQAQARLSSATHAASHAALTRPPKKQIFARLEQCSAVPDFNSYLAFVLSRATARAPRASALPALAHAPRSPATGPAAGGAPKRGAAAEEQRPSRLENAQPGRASLCQGATRRLLPVLPRLSPSQHALDTGKPAAVHGHLGALRAHHRRHRHQVRRALSSPPLRARRSPNTPLQRHRRRRRPEGLAGAARRAGAGAGLRRRERRGRRAGRLLQGARTAAADRATAASYATRQVCEEVPAQVDEDVPGLPMRPAALLVPRLLTLFGRRVAPPAVNTAPPLTAAHNSPHVHLRKRAMGRCDAPPLALLRAFSHTAPQKHQPQHAAWLHARRAHCGA